VLKGSKHLENLGLWNNIKTCIKDVTCEDVALIHGARNKDKCCGIEHSKDFSCFIRGEEFIQNLSYLSRTAYSMGLGSTIIAISQPI
jgi:hypothetical protein